MVSGSDRDQTSISCQRKGAVNLIVSSTVQMIPGSLLDGGWERTLVMRLVIFGIVTSWSEEALSQESFPKSLLCGLMAAGEVVVMRESCPHQKKKITKFVPFSLSPALPTFFTLLQRRLGTRQDTVYNTSGIFGLGSGLGNSFCKMLDLKSVV